MKNKSAFFQMLFAFFSICFFLAQTSSAFQTPKLDDEKFAQILQKIQNKPIIADGKFTVNPQWEWTGGGFASTAEDLTRWMRALYAGDVLQKKSLNEMFGSTTVGEGKGYGLGVELGQGKFGKSYGHDGEFPGYLSDARYFPQYEIAVAVQVNADETSEANKFIASAVDDFAQIIVGKLVGENSRMRKNLIYKKLRKIG